MATGHVSSSETDFYVTTLRRMVTEKLLDPEASTLVVAGAGVDRDALMAAGFTKATISNLDRQGDDQYTPFAWSHQDAENLTLADGEFDQTIIHAGLHHCHSPHRALLEMYRVAARATVVFEARDSMLMRTAVRSGMVEDYETDAVLVANGELGGVNNSEIPNYIYRWTEREVRKTLSSYEPTGPVPVKFYYGLRLPTERIQRIRNPVKRTLGTAAAVASRLVFKAAPRQGNEFAFWAGKPTETWPWLTSQDRGDEVPGPVRFNKDWTPG
jgi:SAM-dependent methyltransferase